MLLPAPQLVATVATCACAPSDVGLVVSSVRPLRRQVSSLRQQMHAVGAGARHPHLAGAVDAAAIQPAAARGRQLVHGIAVSCQHLQPLASAFGHEEKAVCDDHCDRVLELASRSPSLPEGADVCGRRAKREGEERI
jgi:hypothetical protein